MAPIPITIVTGFLGSGKTTLILNLIPQLPKDYKLALLKNEFGDVAIDSQLASSAPISAVHELLNGCICCNLVGQLAPALSHLSTTAPSPLQRIIIETSGSAFPATLAMEINRLARSTGGAYILDGVITVIDVENWRGYEDTSYTAKMQARYTDLVVLNKWEGAGEARVEECRDRVGDLEVGTAVVRSERGWVDRGVLLGVDGGVGMEIGVGEEEDVRQRQQQRPGHDHDHVEDHQQEVEVLSVKLLSTAAKQTTVNLESLETFLLAAPKDEVYRIKAIIWASSPPRSSEDESTPAPVEDDKTSTEYILNWAFGRWTFTPLKPGVHGTEKEHLPPEEEEDGDLADGQHEVERAVLRMTIVLARGEAKTWRNKIEASRYIQMEGGEGRLEVERLL